MYIVYSTYMCVSHIYITYIYMYVYYICYSFHVWMKKPLCGKSFSPSMFIQVPGIELRSSGKHFYPLRHYEIFL